MSRDLSASVEAATLAAVVRPVIGVELDFASGTLRANSSPYTLTINGNSFLGVGLLGGIVPVEETSELGAYQMAMRLSGVPRDRVALALAEHVQGRDCSVWFVTLDESHAVVASPVKIFGGRIDNMLVTMGDTCDVTVTVENVLADWDRPRIRRYTDEDQKSVYAGDRFFEYVPAMQEKELVWGRS